jgi:hypothetical protein
MKTRLSAVIAAMFATANCGASIAAAVVTMQPEIVGDFRTLVIENGVVVENSGGESADIVIAQANPDNVKRQVKIVTSGSDVSAHNLLDVDAIVSSAMSNAFSGATPGPAMKTVKNAPYSAEVVTEKTQMLPDGNQISKRTSAMTFRDSAGRTRQEMRDAKGEVKSIHVNDSVESTRYVISPSRKSATKISIDKDFGKHMAEFGAKMKSMTKDGNVSIIEQSSPGREIVIKRVNMPGVDGKKESRDAVAVSVMRFGDESNISVGDVENLKISAGPIEHESIGIGDAFSRSGMLGNLFQDAKWSSKSTTIQLGSKDIEGVRADGKAVSYTIAAGEIGNKNPITVTTETWYSPELQATVYSKSSDPRVGETVYRLANVRRGEQPASLFAVPEGYSVKETPAIGFSMKKKAGE